MSRKLVVLGGLVTAAAAAAAVVIAVTAIPVSATASAARLLGCPGTAPSVRPSSYLLACGDGNARIQDLTWSSWGELQARGRGMYLYSDCVPDCAQGTVHRVPVTLSLGQPRDLGHPGRRYWTGFTLRFTGSRPAHVPPVERFHWIRGFWGS